MTIEERLIEIYRIHDAWMTASTELDLQDAEGRLAQVIENQKILWGDLSDRATSEPARSAAQQVSLALAEGRHLRATRGFPTQRK